jgi:hypothetical protein
MIKKCGKDSKIPVIMALDAIGAGIDTTGNTGKKYYSDPDPHSDPHWIRLCIEFLAGSPHKTHSDPKYWQQLFM